MGKNETGAAGQRRRRTEPHGRDAHPAGRPRPPGRRAGVHRDGEREPTLVTGQRTGDPWRRGNPAAGASRRRPSGRSAQPRQWHGAASPAGVLVLHGSERAASARSADVVERLVEQERHTGAEAGPEGRILPSILVEDSFTARGRRNRRERIRDSQAKQLRTQAVTRTAPKPFPRPFPQRPDRALCATPNPVDPHHASGRTRRFPDAVPTPVGPSLHPSATRPPPVRVPRAPTSNAPRAFRPSPRPPRGGLEQKRAGWLNPKHARGLASEPGRIRLPRIGARPLPKSPAATSSRSSPRSRRDLSARRGGPKGRAAGCRTRACPWCRSSGREPAVRVRSAGVADALATERVDVLTRGRRPSGEWLPDHPGRESRTRSAPRVDVQPGAPAKRCSGNGRSSTAVQDCLRWRTGCCHSRRAKRGKSAWRIETPRGPVVESLMERGFTVHSINPKQLDRFRDRISPAGAKDDRRDARVLASALRTDPHCLRRLEPTDPAIVDLTRERVRLANRMREQLWRYYPQFLDAVDDDVAAPWALDLWRSLPTPRAGLLRLVRFRVCGWLGSPTGYPERHRRRTAMSGPSAIRASPSRSAGRW